MQLATQCLWLRTYLPSILTSGNKKPMQLLSDYMHVYTNAGLTNK